MSRPSATLSSIALPLWLVCTTTNASAQHRPKGRLLFGGGAAWDAMGRLWDAELGYVLHGKGWADQLGVVGGVQGGDGRLIFAVGPHRQKGLGVGPRFVYRDIDGRGSIGAALDLSLTLVLVKLGLRAGYAGDGAFYGMSLGLCIGWPAYARPRYPKCNFHEDCTDKGEVCVHGICRACGDDADCPDGLVCGPRDRCERPIPD